MIDFTQLKGQTVAIAGASSGIGRETALLLGQLGANLALCARSEAGLNEVAAAYPSQTLDISVDVTSEQDVKRFLETAVRRFGQVDALVNCAGTGVFQPLLDMTAEDFDRMVAVNLKGTFLCCKSFGRHMAENRAGRIINVISIAGTTALPGCGGYSASKFGALGLTKVLQAELRGQGIAVTAVLPGAVDTSFWDRIDPTPERTNMIPVRSLARHLVYLLCQTEGAIVDDITIMPPLGIL